MLLSVNLDHRVETLKYSQFHHKFLTRPFFLGSENLAISLLTFRRILIHAYRYLVKKKPPGFISIPSRSITAKLDKLVD